MRRWMSVMVCAAVFGCGGTTAESAHTDGDFTSSADDTDDTDDGETGDTCDDACEVTCGSQVDECGNAFDGYCDADENCVCEPSQGCYDCDEEVCGPWEQCTETYGCSECHSTTVVLWDPDLACMLDFSSIDHSLIPNWIDVEIDGVHRLKTESCDDNLEGVSWVEWQALLCPNLCSTFETVGELTVSIGCPSGP